VSTPSRQLYQSTNLSHLSI